MLGVFKPALIVGLILLPHAVSAQRFGFSIGMPGSQGAGTNTASMSSRSLPPLPTSAPSILPSRLESLSISLKPLDLTSLYLRPRIIDLPLDKRRTMLPQLPFALDPIAAIGAPQMCVDPMIFRDRSFR